MDLPDYNNNDEDDEEEMDLEEMSSSEINDKLSKLF